MVMCSQTFKKMTAHEIQEILNLVLKAQVIYIAVRYGSSISIKDLILLPYYLLKFVVAFTEELIRFVIEKFTPSPIELLEKQIASMERDKQRVVRTMSELNSLKNSLR
jgi:hypothetical protein